MSKKYVVKSEDGMYMKRSYYGKSGVANVWEATLFNRRCDATNSGNCWTVSNSTIEVEVRISEQKTKGKTK